MANTGYQAYTTLEQYYVLTGLPTGVTKPNVPGDPDYVAPVLNLVDCPLPTTSTTSTTSTSTTTSTTTLPPTTTSTTTTTTTEEPITTTTTSTTTTTTTEIPFFDTVCYGGNASDACHNPTFCFTMTGNGTTFCNSTVFTSLGWNVIATGNYVLSFGGNTLTVSHTFGQDYATVYGGACVSCPPPPITTTSTTTTTTLAPADNYYFARAYVCDGTCNYQFDTFVKMPGAGVIGKFYREPGPISLWSYELVNTVPITSGTYLANVPFDSCLLACAG